LQYGGSRTAAEKFADLAQRFKQGTGFNFPGLAGGQ
jgi:hypothetical protein